MLEETVKKRDVWTDTLIENGAKKTAF